MFYILSNNHYHYYGLKERFILISLFYIVILVNLSQYM
jgi:hypothetical protein